MRDKKSRGTLCRKNQHAFRARVSGFTMIEILVVISVVMIMTGIFIYSIKGAKDAGWRIKCAANLRQIGVALHMYCDDNRDMIPIRLAAVGAAASNFWWVEIAPYLDDEDEVYRCPVPRGTNNMGFNCNMLLGPDGMVQTTPVRLSNVEGQQETVFIFDCTDAQSGTWSNWGGIYQVSKGQQYVADRHSGGANVLWVDGHVSWHLKDEIVDTVTWWDPFD